ncbi:hypothetical protein M569_09449 [Genlisea aurea]|uniref:Uncharacterized protein n=1 Tax=Genlisea aurea TaxID=192259 RepID=S8DQM9_9LAMI|nr:hypothetical protein M569_09449 [Genlisea aurea]
MAQGTEIINLTVPSIGLAASVAVSPPVAIVLILCGCVVFCVWIIFNKPAVHVPTSAAPTEGKKPMDGTKSYELFFGSSTNLSLTIFSDSDYARDPDDRKSTTGYVFIINGSEDQVADIMTNPIKAESFARLRTLLGMRPIPIV